MLIYQINHSLEVDKLGRWWVFSPTKPCQHRERQSLREKLRGSFQQKKKKKKTKPRVVNSVQPDAVLAKACINFTQKTNPSYILLLYDTTNNEVMVVLVDYNFINLNNLFAYFIGRLIFNKEERKGKCRKSKISISLLALMPLQ